MGFFELACFYAMKLLLSPSLTQKFFKEERFNEHTIWVEKTKHTKGTLAEVAHGGLNNIFIPVGIERKRWEDFYPLT